MQIISFIGLGNMGGPMAANLAKAGYQVRAFDVSSTALAKATQAGCYAATSIQDAIIGAHVVISMLPTGRHVLDLMLTGDKALFPLLAKGTWVIDCSTIEADTARHLAQQATDFGLAFIDAPVSGGVAGAQAGTLTFIVGASTAQFQQAQPILAAMGRNIFHAGDHGAGQIAKACNNMLLAILMTGTCEALSMGIKNGLDPAVLSQIMAQSSGNNWVLQHYNPVPHVMENTPASNAYQGGFQVDLMFKDLGLAMALSQQSACPTPMGSTARALFNLHKNQGQGQLDFSSILRLYQDEP